MFTDKTFGTLAAPGTVRGMEDEWDEAKRRSNLEKHGVDFSAIEAFEWGSAVIQPSCRGEELRYTATGFIGNRLHYVVYTIRGDTRRIISLRKTNARERRRYEQVRRH